MMGRGQNGLQKKVYFPKKTQFYAELSRLQSLGFSDN